MNFHKKIRENNAYCIRKHKIYYYTIICIAIKPIQYFLQNAHIKKLNCLI